MINKGTIIGGRYEILKQIDKGGMSIVYLAYDVRLKKNFAIKDILKQDNNTGSPLDNELLLKCLKKEAELLVALDHPNLPKIYDIIREDEHIYVVMDYIAGETLKKKVEREGKCDIQQVISWGIQLAEILNYLHNGTKETVIYRDMKPHNIMLTPEGKIKLIDFGIAISDIQDKTGVMDKTKNLGTKIYAAPEQIVSKITDARTDIYSLGVVLYQLITGRNFRDNTKLAPIKQVAQTIPEGLEFIIEKCLKINPDERYQSADKLLYDLKNINKLTKTYKRGLIKRIAIFGVCILMTISFSIVGFIGYKGRIRVHAYRYEIRVNSASEDLSLRKYKAGIGAAKGTIDFDPKKDDGYIMLLDGYVSMGMVKEGTEAIEGYLSSNSEMDKDDMVKFKLGVTYFDYKNYPMAIKQFASVDSGKIPLLKHYILITQELSEKNINYSELQDRLNKFKDDIDKETDSVAKLEGYNSLCNVYNTNKDKLNDANNKIITILEEGQNDIDKISKNYIQDKLTLQYGQKLAPAYKEMADKNVKTNPQIADEYNKKAIIKYSEISNLLINIQGGLEDKKHNSLIKGYYDAAGAIKGAENNSEYKKLKSKVDSLNKK